MPQISARYVILQKHIVQLNYETMHQIRTKAWQQRRTLSPTRWQKQTTTGCKWTWRPPAVFCPLGSAQQQSGPNINPANSIGQSDTTVFNQNAKSRPGPVCTITELDWANRKPLIIQYGWVTFYIIVTSHCNELDGSRGQTVAQSNFWRVELRLWLYRVLGPRNTSSQRPDADSPHSPSLKKTELLC